MAIARHFLPVCVLAVLCTACAGDSGRYPSLTMRPGERVEGIFQPGGVETPTAQPTYAPEPPVASPALVEQLSNLLADARSAHGEFLETEPRARRLASAAQGQEVGSNAWASAQVALADLDSARSRSATSLGTLDILYVDATLESQAREEIAATRDSVLALLQEEDQTLAQLRALIR